MRPLISEFITNYRLMIELICGIQLAPLFWVVPEDSSQAAVSKANHQNHLLILAYYSHTFTAYTKYCQTLQRPIGAHYVPGNLVTVHDADDEGDMADEPAALQ